MQEELEVHLIKSMISLITRYPDVLDRIEVAVEAIVEAEEDPKEQMFWMKNNKNSLKVPVRSQFQL